MARMRKALKILEGLFVLAFLAAMGALLYLSVVYHSAPLQPQPEIGKTIGWNSHGTIYYITVQQSELFSFIFYTAITLFFCIGAIVGERMRGERNMKG